MANKKEDTTQPNSSSPSFETEEFQQPRAASTEPARDPSVPSLEDATEDGLPSYRERTRTLANLIASPHATPDKPKDPQNSFEEEHHTLLSEHAAVLWRHNKITDITVKLGGIAYPAHKTVLSCYSRYFKEMLLEAKASIRVVHLKLPSVTNEAFAELLKYMYTGNLHLTVQNIGEIYTASRKLEMEGAQHLCMKVLTGKSRHGVHSVFVYVTAKNLGIEDSASKALKTMCRLFEKIVGTSEFLDLSCSQLCEYLNCDEIAVRSEVIVYLAALKWISVRYLDREPLAADVLSCVRFPLMTLNEILACHSPPLLPGVTELKEVKDMLLKATCFVAAKTVNEENRFERYACKQRHYLLPRETVLLWDPNIFDPSRYSLYMGSVAATTIQAHYKGFKTRREIEKQDNAARVIQQAYRKYYSSSEPGSEEEAGDDSETKTRKESSFVENIKKSVSGFVRRFSQSAEEESEQEDEYIQIQKMLGTEKSAKENEIYSPMEARKKPFSSLEVLTNQTSQFLKGNSKISESEDMLRSSENENLPHFSKNKEVVHRIHRQTENESNHRKPSVQFDPRNDSVSYKHKRSPIRQAFLITGGFSSNNIEDENSGKEIFVYYPASNEWSKYGEMPEPRHHHCSTYMDGYVYIIGGCNPKDTKAGKMTARKSCFKFDVKNEKWQKIAKMNHCRMYHAVSTLGGKIYVVGGKDHNDRLLRSIEVYHPEDNVWKELDSPLDTPTMGMGVTTQGGKLWIIGGMVQDLSGKICVTKEVSCYDPKKEKWICEVKNLPGPRSFGTAVTCEDRVFVIGGTTYADLSLEELESLSSVLQYEFKSNRWVLTSELPSARHFVEVCVLEKNLFSLGGLSSKAATIDDVLLHDEASGSWKLYGTLPKALCGFSAATVPEH